jgi:DNA-binding IscR family transcriptional regulator
MVECFSEQTNTCMLAGRCKLRHLLAEATGAYLERLDHVPLSALLSVPDGHPGCQPMNQINHRTHVLHPA